METTTLSTKGQIVLPKSIRDSRAWGPGTEFTVEETREGILLRPGKRFPKTTLQQVSGFLQYKGSARTLKDMQDGIAAEVRRRYDRSGH